MDKDGDKIRRMIAERALGRSGRVGYDSGGMEGWTDRMVAAGRYKPGITNGQMRIDVGDGPLVAVLPPERFAELYGQVPPDFGPQWLEMQKARAGKR